MNDRPFANTPEPPYEVVIFTSRLRNDAGYGVVADAMIELARKQPGFLGLETVGGNDRSITISYWEDSDSIEAWRNVAAHQAAQRQGIESWYESYCLRTGTVRKERRFEVGDATKAPGE